MVFFANWFKKKNNKRTQKYRLARELGASAMKAHKMMHLGIDKFEKECDKLLKKKNRFKKKSKST